MYSTSSSKKSIYATHSSVNSDLLKQIIELLNKNGSKLSDIKLLINDLDPFSQVLTNYSDMNGLIALVKIINIQIDKNIALEKQLLMKHYVSKSFNTTIKTVINTQYIKYIEKYGIPNDGIFIPELLAEFN